MNQDANYQALVLGALLHDIGKFMQRAEVECKHEKNEKEMQLWCPHWNDVPTHRHVLWTRAFFDNYSDYLPSLPQNPEKQQDNLANLASKHHKPETPLQWIVAESDRLSSGMDRLPKDEEVEATGRDAFKRIRLRPVLEEINLGEEEKVNGKYRCKMGGLSLARDVVFPELKEKIHPEEGESLVPCYKGLWQGGRDQDGKELPYEGFINELRKLTQDSIPDFTDSLLFLLEKYTWCIPSSTMDLPDISLFDHLKTTAAIAACLYDYLRDKQLEEKAVQNRSEERYLLVCGDLSGIQKFIYSITSKGAAKGLKGRSFYLQLLTEAIANFILRQSNYLQTNLLYASGGKFFLLLANRYAESLRKWREMINKHLLEKYNGEIFLALGWTALKGSDFLELKFPPKWKDASGEANKQKRQKFKNEGFNQLFDVFGKGRTEKSCQICQKEGELEVLSRDDEEIKICSECKQMEQLGEKLTKANFLVEIYNEVKGISDKIPILTTSYYLLSNSKEIDQLSGERMVISSLNKTDFLSSTACSNWTYGFKFIGGNCIPRDENGNLLTFNDLAEYSTGIKRLGVLRMDVDNLGLIFIEGFGRQASISRVTSLSRNLSLFFAGYLNSICQEEPYRNKAFIVYSGGDDLFVVGAWNTVVDLAGRIRAEFCDFACRNECLTLSGGIALTGKKYPIYKGAELAGIAEEEAKGLKREFGPKEKDALTFLDKPLDWQDVEVAVQIKDILCRCLVQGKDGQKLSRGFLDRLRNICLLYSVNKANWEQKEGTPMEIIKERIQYNKWLWRMVYSLGRYADQNPLFSNEITQIRDILLNNNGAGSGREVIDFLDVPVRWAEFLTRKEE